MSFSDDTVSLVVGGTSGIGRAIADALADRPGRVEVASRSTGLDVSDEDAVAAFLGAFGPLDNLVMTAGSSAPGGAVHEVGFDDAKAAFDTKFWGSIALAKHAANRVRPGGTITLTSGFVSRRTVPGTYVKAAMNAGIEATAKILARELAPVRVNVVSPGLTDTAAYAAMDETARTGMLDRAARVLPAGRAAAAPDVATAYLLAIENPSMTGAVIDVDGGALIN